LIAGNWGFGIVKWENFLFHGYNGLAVCFVADFEALACQNAQIFIKCRNAESRTV